MKKNTFSIIVPTYGRDKELFAFLDSVKQQDYDHSLLEIIIVDQNDKIDLAPRLEEYRKHLQVKHVHSSVKGIAAAKNTGIRHSINEVITFADDDSTYYPDTIRKANQCLEEHPEVDYFYGKIFDRANNVNLIRQWKKEPLKLNIRNYHLNYIPIALFTRVKTLWFDERFGVGTRYGMGEELDYLLRSFESGYNVWYTPAIEVWHPNVTVLEMPPQKAYSYARGYGAICRKHLSLTMLWNLFISSSYQVLMMLGLLVTGKMQSSRMRYLALAGRIKGFFEFRG